MDQPIQSLPPLKTALFVDFDNIYIGLSKSDPQAAERFASDPTRWLSWLEQGYPLRSGERSFPPRSRSILVRRCYPNPDAGFRRFRSFFTSAAFSVIDCPTMTHTGKNSSDIYMVMDILDALNHKTYFDEFIILSGDSDFMPVLLRLRAHDRRTTTLNIDFMPPAFRAACDLVISEEEFIEDALGVTHEAGSVPSVLTRGTVPTELLQQMALRVYSAAKSEGEVAGASLPEILKDFREFRDSTNWLGFGTSQRLAEALAACEARIHLVRINPMMYKILVKTELAVAATSAAAVSMVAAIKPKGKPTTAAGRPARLAGRPSRSVELPAQKANSSPPAFAVPAADDAVTTPDDAVASTNDAVASTNDPREKPDQAETNPLRVEILSVVKELVAGSPDPLLLARVSQYVVNKMGHQVVETQWAGAGSFKRLLQSAVDLGLEITTQPEPGYIFDPLRHTPPSLTSGAEPSRSRAANGLRRKLSGARRDEEKSFSLPEAEQEGCLLDDMPEPYSHHGGNGQEEYHRSLPSLDEFIRRVSRVTGAPDLSPQQFALVFNGIVNELQQIANGEKSYHTYQSAKAISDWCAENGCIIARGNIMLILKGIIFQDGPRFAKSPGSYNASDLAAVVRKNIKALCRRSQMEFSESENHLLNEWILGGLNQTAAHSNGGIEPENDQ